MSTEPLASDLGTHTVPTTPVIISAHRALRMRTTCCRLIVSLSLLISACQLGSQVVTRPNVILIIADDHGYPYFGFMGSEQVETPHLDRLASEGVVFTHGFTTASGCRPSLNSLLTGLHPIQWEARNQQLERQGIGRVPFFEIEHFETLPKLLAGAGYTSFQGGKYWEGSYQQGGFDTGTKGVQDGVAMNIIGVMAGGEGLRLGRDTMEPLWDFLDQHRDGRFFVWFAPHLPHLPHDPPERLLSRYDEHDLSQQASAYFATITWLDERVGELLDYLDRNDLRRNTLIIFLSDNGWQQPLRGNTSPGDGDHGKGSIYEYGFRTPIVVSLPGHIAPGRRSDALVSGVDVFTTILDYASVAPPEDRVGLTLRPHLDRGHSLPRQHVIAGMKIRRLPAYVAGEQDRSPVSRQRAYFLRTDRWRYIWFMDAGIEELYEIETDPEESMNVVANHQELAATFRDEIDDWLKRMRAPYEPDEPVGVGAPR